MHFAKGPMPPVNGFWSVTMYTPSISSSQSTETYTLSARNPLKSNADGSVNLLLQHDSPGHGKESNWLPAPEEKFILMLRLYSPKDTPPSLLDGTWTIPRRNPGSVDSACRASGNLERKSRHKRPSVRSDAPYRC